MVRMLVVLLAAGGVGLAAAPALATSPGREGRIAFFDFDQASMRGYALFTIKPDATGRQRIFPMTQEAHWSADGKTLAWHSNELSLTYVGRADGSDARLVASGSNGPFALSPDARTLVVARYLPRNADDPTNGIATDLLVVDVATGSERLLTYDASSPTFSPDGRQVAFVDESDPRAGRPRGINVIRLDGTGRNQLFARTGHSHLGQNLAGGLDWSPDGKLIAFSQWLQRRAQGQLRTVDVRSGRIRVLFRDPGIGLAWSPTGRRIAASRVDRNSRPTVVTVPARGGRAKSLGFRGYPLAWQPLPRRR